MTPLDLDRVSIHGIDETILFVATQAPFECQDGHYEQTVFVFTHEGVRSRTARLAKVLDEDCWIWLRKWEGGEIPWSKPFPYEGQTPDECFAWHEHQHGWFKIAFTIMDDGQ